MTFPSSPADASKSPKQWSVSGGTRARVQKDETGECGQGTMGLQARRSVEHTLGGPSHDVYCLCVLRQRGQILYFTVLAIAFDFPQLRGPSAATVLEKQESGALILTLTLLSPPAVASLPLLPGSKWAE